MTRILSNVLLLWHICWLSYARDCCRNHTEQVTAFDATLDFSKAVCSHLGVPHHLQRMPPPASRSAILRLLNASRHTACPCHGCSTARTATGSLQAVMNLRKYATPVEASKEYAFEVCSLCARHMQVTETASRGLCCEFALRRWGNQRGWNGFQEYGCEEGMLISSLVESVDRRLRSRLACLPTQICSNCTPSRQ